MLSRPSLTKPPGANEIRTEYDNTGGSWVRTTRDTSVVTVTEDGFGRPIRTVDSVGVETRRQYDAEGRLVYESYPFEGSANIGTAIAYDGLGRVTRRTHPDGSSSTYAYGAGTVTIVDEKERVTVQRFEAFGDPDEVRLVGVTDADRKSWTYRYNGLGKLTDVLAPDGMTRTWRYRRLADGTGTDRLEVETHPESGQTTYEYDAAGLLFKKTDANGSVFTYTYDRNDRVRWITAGGRVSEITYEPGTDDRRTMRIDDVTTIFGYEPLTGRLRSRTDVLNGMSFQVTFAYDGNDRLRLLTYPSGRRVGYDYDNEGRITRVFDDTAQGRNYATGLAHHPSGAVAGYMAGNGISHSFTYHPQRYWPTTMTAGTLMQLSYEDYDRVGNVHTIRDSRPARNQTFGYDALDRLESAESPDWSLTYRYDVHGNRVTTPATTYEYWPNTLRLQAQTSGGVTQAFTYDNNGNVTTANGTTYTYTPFNMLETTRGAGIDSTFLYDADHWRLAKIASGATTVYLRGPGNELLTEWTNPGTTPRTFRDYIYAASRLIAVVEQR